MQALKKAIVNILLTASQKSPRSPACELWTNLRNRQIMSSQSKSTEGADVPFGEWLRHLREAKDALQRDVAAAADMDVAVLSKIELGQRVATEEQTRGLAKFF